MKELDRLIEIAAINAIEKEIGRIYRSRLPFFRQAKVSNSERVLKQVKSIYFESFDAFLAHVPAGEEKSLKE